MSDIYWRIGSWLLTIYVDFWFICVDCEKGWKWMCPFALLFVAEKVLFIIKRNHVVLLTYPCRKR